MVKLIVAKASNNVIGKDNDLIWDIPADMRFFTETTRGQIVIMGRRNWDSIPLKYRPLPGRLNAVVTRNESFTGHDCAVYHSLEAAIDAYRNDIRDVFIIGGAQIYAYSIEHDLVDEMYITEINHAFEGDAWFPTFDETKWNRTIVMEHDIDEKNPYSFVVYKYSKRPK